MIDEDIVVSDSNIFFDLISVDLLDCFFRLPCKITKTDFVINEIINPDEAKKVQVYILSKQLFVKSFDYTELRDVNKIFLNNENNASITDCSVWYYAKKTGGRLLTGDAKLKRSASKDGVKVSGLLFILDNLVEYSLLDGPTCASKLQELVEINSRLPLEECRKRISLWRRDYM